MLRVKVPTFTLHHLVEYEMYNSPRVDSSTALSLLPTLPYLTWELYTFSHRLPLAPSSALLPVLSNHDSSIKYFTLLYAVSRFAALWESLECIRLYDF